jgi:hypothetical protein
MSVRRSDKERQKEADSAAFGRLPPGGSAPELLELARLLARIAADEHIRALEKGS